MNGKPMKKENCKNIANGLTIALMLHAGIASGQDVGPETLLIEHSDEFRREVIEVTEDVYVAVGWGGSNSAMVVGENGLIIVDTRESKSAAEAVWAEFRKISQKPVLAIIYTHGHGDHTNGTTVFAEDYNPAVYARANLGSEQKDAAPLSSIMMRRTFRQFGIQLEQGSERVNIGIGERVLVDQSGSGFVPPTVTFADERLAITIDSIEIEMVAAPGETDDQLYVWLPGKKVLFPGDNFYRAFPNLYPIRGSGYRDVLEWSNSLEKMRNEQPEFLVPSHTRPIMGAEKIDKALSDYAAAIRYVYDETIKGINQGLTPDQLVELVTLPDALAISPYLVEYYGMVPWAVRSIFSGKVGWFDGNPTTLLPLGELEEAQRISDLSGGAEALFNNT